MAGGRGKSLQTSERWEWTAAALTSFLFLSGEAAVLLLFFFFGMNPDTFLPAVRPF